MVSKRFLTQPHPIYLFFFSYKGLKVFTNLEIGESGKFGLVNVVYIKYH